MTTQTLRTLIAVSLVKMFAVIRKSAVVPPHPENLDRDLWGKEDDMHEAAGDVHEGLGFNRDEPRFITNKLSEVVAHHEPIAQVDLVNGSFAVTSTEYEMACGTTSDGEQFVVLMEGKITNGDELMALYNMEGMEAQAGGNTAQGAELVKHLYCQGFTDAYGDWSDQPATVLSAMTGDFAFVIYDAAAGYVLAARSAQGNAHMYWGLDKEEHVLIFATHRADNVAHLSDFPRGCYFESQLIEGQGDSTVTSFTKPLPSMRGLTADVRVDSSGHLRAMMFRSKSGVPLTEDADMETEADNVPAIQAQ